MRLAYGWNDEGKFVLAVLDDNHESPKILQRISITRDQSNKIDAQLRFGRKGETRFLEDHEQLLPDEGNS